MTESNPRASQKPAVALDRAARHRRRDLGQVDATVVPRYGGEPTFARLPRLSDVPSADVAILGVPFDTGVSYRPGPGSAPGTSGNRPGCCARTTRRPEVSPFAALQVADAGDIGVNPFDIAEAITAIEHGARDLLERAPAAAHPRRRPHDRPPAAARRPAAHGPVAVVHFDAHLDTWDTYFGAPYTHGTPFRRAFEEGLLDPDGCLTSASAGRSTTRTTWSRTRRSDSSWCPRPNWSTWAPSA